MGWCQSPSIPLIFGELSGTNVPPPGTKVARVRANPPLGERLRLAPFQIQPSLPTVLVGGADGFSRRSRQDSSAPAPGPVGVAVVNCRHRRCFCSAVPSDSTGVAERCSRHGRRLRAYRCGKSGPRGRFTNLPMFRSGRFSRATRWRCAKCRDCLQWSVSLVRPRERWELRLFSLRLLVGRPARALTVA